MSNVTDVRYEIDAADRRLIGALRRSGRASITDLAAATDMARGTVQSRLRRLVDEGVITGWGPDLDPRASDHPVVAFTTLSIAQGTHSDVVRSLADMAEVLEVHVVTGGGDLLCRIVARSNDHLHELIQQIVSIEGIVRSDSQLALRSPVQRSLADLVGR